MVTFGAIFGVIVHYWYLVGGAVLLIGGIVATVIIRKRRRVKVQESRREVTCIIFNGTIKSPIRSISQDEIKDFTTMKHKTIGKKKVFFIRPYRAPMQTLIPAKEKVAVVVNLSKSAEKRYAAQLQTLEYLDQLSDGHYGDGSVALAEISPFKYEPWMPNIIPEKEDYQVMTPNWLFGLLHWEEQAKVFRLKASTTLSKLHFGAAIFAIGAGLLALFMIAMSVGKQGG